MFVFSCCFKRFRKTFVSAEKTIVSKLLFSFWQLMFCFRKCLCLPSSLPFVVRVFSLVDFGFAFHTSSNCVPAPPRLLFPTDTAPPSKHHLSGSATSFQPAWRRVVFVANLPADITAEQLRADFAVLGAIVHVDASLQQRLIITSIYYTPVCFCSMRSTLFHIISAGVIFI